MDIENKQTLTNTFTGGMNTDVSDALLKSDQYRFAANLRLVTSEDNNTGELHMIRGGATRGRVGTTEPLLYMDYVIGATQIRNIGVIVSKDHDGDWYIHTFLCDDDLPDVIPSDTQLLNYRRVFGPCTDHFPENVKLSLVTRYEDEDNIKLYIADGVHPIMLVNLAKTYTGGDINEIISYPKAIFKKPIFCGLTSGSLKAGVVEYSYQFFNDGGNYTEISPSTKLIPIHKGTANNASGYPKDTVTNRGVSLKFDLSENDSFDSLRIYRIMYTEAGLLPTIEVIYENKLPDSNIFNFVDNGQKAIATITLEEYNSITGIHIIPKTIESKDDYMFASNIRTDGRLDLYDAIRNWDSRAFQCDLSGEYQVIDSTSLSVTIRNGAGGWHDIPSLNDDCTNPDPDVYKYSYKQNGYDNNDDPVYNTYFGGDGPNISWKFVRTSVDGDSTSAGTNDFAYGNHGSASDEISRANSSCLFNSSLIGARYIRLEDQDMHSLSPVTPQSLTIDMSDYTETTSGETRNYGNEKVTYSLKSLRRGETYRYGIILFSDKGETTNVKWIADIKVPELYTPNFNTFQSHHNGMELEVYPLGIEFLVDISDIRNDSTIIQDGVNIVGYEIVRCPRTEADMRTVSLGVLSRPCAKFIDPGSASSQKIFPLTPTGWLTTCGYWAGGYLLTKYWPYDDGDINDLNGMLGWLMTNNYFNPSDLAYLGDSGVGIKIPGSATFSFGSDSSAFSADGSMSCTFVADPNKVADEEFDATNILYYLPTETITISSLTVRVTNTGQIAQVKIYSLLYTGEIRNIDTNQTVKANIQATSSDPCILTLYDSWPGVSIANKSVSINSGTFDAVLMNTANAGGGYFGNYSVYQFISPEVSYLKDSMRDLIVDNVNVSPQLFLFGTTYDSGENFALRKDPTRWWRGGSSSNKKSWIYNQPTPAGTLPGNTDYDGSFDWGDSGSSWKGEKNGTPPNPNMVKGLFMYPGNTYTKVPLNGSYGQSNVNVLNRSNGPMSPMIYKNVVCRLACMYNYMTTYTYYYSGNSNFGDHSDTEKTEGFYNNIQKPNFNQSHQYIKLYEQSGNVVRNNGNSYINPFNKIAYCSFSGSTITAQLSNGVTDQNLQDINTEIRQEINHSNDIVVSSVAFPDVLSWDDFSDSTSDATQNFRVTYSDKTTPIGTDSYNNWVSSGMYGIGFNEVPPSIGDMQYGQKRMIDRYYGGMGGVNGPAGSCVLLKLDIAANHLIPNTTCTYEIYQPYSQTGESNMGYTTPSGNGLVANLDDFLDVNERRWVYRESALGTYLVNITRNVTPYGGKDFAHRQSSSYNSYGDYFTFNDQGYSYSYVFNGDCFIQPFEYTSLHKMSSALKYSYSVRTANITYAIPVETNINIAYEHGFSFSKDGKNPLIQELPSDVNGQFIQDRPLYAYNGIYSINTLSKTFAAEEDFDRISSQQNFDYRTYHSTPKINNEALDSWIKYMPANHLDVDTRFGPITGLRTFGNKLVYWQSGATGLFSVNERTLITDDNNLPLILGTGGILTRYDYVSQQNGMHENQYADTQSNLALYWFDYDKHELCAMMHDGSVLVLSKAKNVLNYLNKIANSRNLVDKPALVYDSKFNEIIAYVGDDPNIKPFLDDEISVPVSLVYNENLQVFTGIYTIPVIERCVFTNNLYLVGYEDRYPVSILWNKLYSDDNPTFDLLIYLYPNIKYIINELSTINKTFDTFKFGGRVYGGNQFEGDQYSSASTSGRPPLSEYSYESINMLRFEFSTPLKQHGVFDGKNLDNIEYDFRGAIPRNGQLLDNEILFGDRLRGKTMQCEMYSLTSDYDFSLQYIATKYRISWT